MSTIPTTQNYPTIQNVPTTATSTYDQSNAANYSAAAGTTASHAADATIPGTSGGGQDAAGNAAATSQPGQIFQPMSFFDDPDMSSFDLFDTGRDC